MQGQWNNNRQRARFLTPRSDWLPLSASHVTVVTG